MKSSGGGFCPPSRFPLKLAAIFLGMAALGMAIAAVTRPHAPKPPPTRPVQAVVQVLISYQDGLPAVPVDAEVYFASDEVEMATTSYHFKTPKNSFSKAWPPGPVKLMVQPLDGKGKPDGRPVAFNKDWPSHEKQRLELIIERPGPRPGTTHISSGGPVSSNPRIVIDPPPHVTHPSADSEYEFLAHKPLTDADVVNKSPDQLAIMQNWPLAKHGQRFKTNPVVIDYFKKRSWYRASTDDAYSSLSQIEQANVDFIKKKRGL